MKQIVNPNWTVKYDESDPDFATILYFDGDKCVRVENKKDHSLCRINEYTNLGELIKVKIYNNNICVEEIKY